MTAVVNEESQVVGIFTEGDLRRLIERVGDIRNIKIEEVMTRSPKVIHQEALASEAAHILNTVLCNQLLVVDENNTLIGALHLQDLMTAKVI